MPMKIFLLVFYRIYRDIATIKSKSTQMPTAPASQWSSAPPRFIISKNPFEVSMVIKRTKKQIKKTKNPTFYPPDKIIRKFT